MTTTSAWRVWRSRTRSWDHYVNDSPGFHKIRSALLAASRPDLGDRAVDLGAGTGFVTLALSSEVSQVEAVDFSPQMLAQLQSRAKSLAISNVTTTVASLEEFDLPDASVDLIVSSYALHHLRDQDKAALVMRAARWLRPGGRLVIADMMFGRGTSARDRAILRSKAASMLARGPAGWWRIARNLVKFGLRVGSERPASPRVWRSYLERAGFRDVQFEEIIGEAGLVAAKVGDRPAATGEPGGAIPPGGA